MATRHLRKVQQQLAATAAPAPDEARGAASSSEEDGAESPPGRPPFNPFDLLTDDEDAEEQQDDGEEAEEEEAAPPAEQQQQQQQQKQKQQPAAAAAAAGAGKKSKSKKKKSGKGAAAAAAAGEDAALAAAGAAAAAAVGPAAGKGRGGGGGGDDIDAILRELDLQPAGGSAAAGAGGGAGGRRGGKAAGGGGGGGGAALLGVDVKRLRGEDELRRIFGAGVIEAVDRAEAAEAGRGGAAARRYGWAPRNAPRRRAMKRGTLVAPRDDWPYYEPGTLSMEAAGTASDGTPMFRYVWPPTYRSAQHLFEAAQGSYDPNAVAAVLHQLPYHVDSLLAMADLYRAMGEGQYAEESLNRALYALEAAWCPAFDPATARCRLDIALPENRGLFVALFRHAQALSRRGCHASALECSKLLLALDPADPMGALQLVDYLALRAGRYSWLERFVERFDGGAALGLLPNFAYALALARFRREAAAGAGGGASTSGGGPDGGSDGEGGDGGSARPSSRDTLVAAMLLHPLVVPQLMARLQGQGVGKDSHWKALLERRLFKAAGDGGSATLAHLASIFVERSHMLWKAGDVQGWMRRAADAACDAADSGAAAASGAGAGALPLSAAEWAAVAREAFPADGGNDFGHLRLSDFSDAVNALPREELAAAMQGGGGMADDAMDDAVAAQIREAMRQAQAGGAGRVGAEELAGANPLVMLLRSLLPWVDAGQQPDYGADEEGGGGGGGGGAGGREGQQ
ncbi:hypothetical protein Rsub_12422 [Raphidocelis subcapitata]|uniref:Transcription factor 25 n=1 Tax=Raphidocelis subcapitata TaxID=307507 RepID=A0A2V0PNZ4_9CHLO|nr:hypothetical protein Rsub_12422 [Raphidocelis subcapitata]|eukprot:GBF99710.1 hypothetical protein Rsub_12422 [Raphidocelis subcapitata]